MLLYALTIFLSAVLLFQVEPSIAKIILPWFGGSSAVWTTCLVFFQLSLLLGYFYAYTSVKYLGPKLQARVHMLLLALSGLTLPILPGNAWKLTGPQDPTFHILLLLAATVGLPFLLLSSTTPLLQAWYATERPVLLPYRLFALSNTGSMLALLSYPFIIEPLVSTQHQATIWSAAYALAAVLCAAAAMRVRTEASSGDLIEIQAGPGSRSEPATELRINSFSARAPGDGSRTGHDGGEIRRYGSSRLAPSRRTQLLWVAFAACASARLLAITNNLSQNV